MSGAVERAVQEIAAGGIVVVADDADRENEGDLVCAAESMTDGHMAFFLRAGSGIVCVPMTEERARDLDLPLMVEDNSEAHHTAFTVTVDHARVSTGISAVDRALTVRALADPSTTPGDLRRPGHVFPLRARTGGVLRRAGHTEAAVDLVRLARRGSVGAITELVDDHGVPLSGPRIRAFAARHDLPLIDIAELIRYRRESETLVRRSGQARIPTRHGRFEAISYRSIVDDVEHVAFTLGDVATAGVDRDGILVRVHSECVTGDIFGSRRCDCGAQVDAAMEAIGDEGVGVVVYLRGQEGRGIGLGHKLQAYQLQDRGADTVDANLALGLPVDSRHYGVGAAILTDLGVRRMRLITNNPHKYSGLAGHDLEIVQRVALRPLVTPENIAYLRTKRDRMGHLLELPMDGEHGDVRRCRAVD